MKNALSEEYLSLWSLAQIQVNRNNDSYDDKKENVTRTNESMINRDNIWTSTYVVIVLSPDSCPKFYIPSILFSVSSLYNLHLLSYNCRLSVFFSAIRFPAILFSILFLPAYFAYLVIHGSYFFYIFPFLLHFLLLLRFHSRPFLNPKMCICFLCYFPVLARLWMPARHWCRIMRLMFSILCSLMRLPSVQLTCSP